MRIFPICMLLLGSFLGLAEPSQAELVQVMDIRFSTDLRLADLNPYNIRAGWESPMTIGGAPVSESAELIPLYGGEYGLLATNLTPLLNRTLVLPPDPDSWEDHHYMYSSGYFSEQVEIWTKDASGAYFDVFREPIPDLSGFDVGDYYLSHSFTDDGITTSAHIQLLADATPIAAPVPEPSTLVTLVSGAMVCGFIGWRSRHRNSISP